VAPRDREKVLREMDRVHITTMRQGNELVVTTDYPRHRAFPWISPLSVVPNFDLEYRIKVPRSARLIVRHDDGEVHVDDITGNVDVKARQGLIALRLVSDKPLAIDAKSDYGSVNSDFAGGESRHPWPFGHQFVENISAASQRLHLRIVYGDVVILKAHEPQAPPPVQ
jgi:hypothetical protein